MFTIVLAGGTSVISIEVASLGGTLVRDLQTTLPVKKSMTVYATFVGVTGLPCGSVKFIVYTELEPLLTSSIVSPSLVT
jgi:hypothetical protein